MYIQTVLFCSSDFSNPLVFMGGVNHASVNRGTSLWPTLIIFFVSKVDSICKTMQETATLNFKWKSHNYCKMRSLLHMLIPHFIIICLIIDQALYIIIIHNSVINNHPVYVCVCACDRDNDRWFGHEFTYKPL